jgi:hypothetical protein
VLSTAVGNDALNQGAPKVLEVNPINAKHTEEANDALNQGAPKVLKGKPINVLSTEEANDALNQGAPKVLKAKRINVKHTVEVNGALNQGVERVLERKPINVLSTVEVNGALNQGAPKVLERNPTNAKHTEEANDVQTVSIGQTPEAQILFTMTIAQPVSSDCFPMILVQGSYTSIPRRFGSEMRFRNEPTMILDFVGLSTTSRCIPETVIVRIGGVSIIAN